MAERVISNFNFIHKQHCKKFSQAISSKYFLNFTKTTKGNQKGLIITSMLCRKATAAMTAFYNVQ